MGAVGAEFYKASNAFRGSRLAADTQLLPTTTSFTTKAQSYFETVGEGIECRGHCIASKSLHRPDHQRAVSGDIDAIDATQRNLRHRRECRCGTRQSTLGYGYVGNPASCLISRNCAARHHEEDNRPHALIAQNYYQGWSCRDHLPPHVHDLVGAAEMPPSIRMRRWDWIIPLTPPARREDRIY